MPWGWAQTQEVRRDYLTTSTTSSQTLRTERLKYLLTAHKAAAKTVLQQETIHNHILDPLPILLTYWRLSKNASYRDVTYIPIKVTSTCRATELPHNLYETLFVLNTFTTENELHSQCFKSDRAAGGPQASPDHTHKPTAQGNSRPPLAMLP